MLAFHLYLNWLPQIPTPKEFGENLLASFPFLILVVFAVGILLIVVTFLALKLNFNWLAIAPIPEEELRDEFWRRNQKNIEIRLQQSLKNGSAIATPQELENVQMGERTRVETNQSILEIFEESDRRLLIIGESGSGKTTELLKLARSLGEKVKDDSLSPIPFILDLSTWQEKSLWNWIIQEIERQSGLDRKWGQKWLECGQIIPLLDSLDDVEAAKRERVIIEIDALRECDVEQLKAFVLCCQTEDYQRIRADEKRTWGGSNLALHLCELSDRQIESYLQQCQAIQLWQDLSSQSRLIALARIPMLLNLIVATYPDGLPENDLQDPKECENRLLDDFLSHRLAPDQNAKSRSFYNTQKARDYLTWLAIKMEREGMKQREFAIDGLQPAWLDNQMQWQQYRWLCGIVLGLFWGLSGWLLLNWKLGLIQGFAFILSESRRIAVESIEFRTALTFSWRRIRRVLLRGLLWGFCLDLIFTVIVTILLWLNVGTLAELIDLLNSGLGYIMFYGLLLGLFSGLQNDLKVREYPNQGAWEKVKKAVILSAWVIPVFILDAIFVHGTGMTEDISLAEILGPSEGGLILLLFTVGNGEMLVRHLALRWVLFCQGRIPWNYAKFLNKAGEVGILMRSGGRYRFNGDRLQKYLAREISLPSYSIPKYQFTWRSLWVMVAFTVLIYWIYISLDGSFLSFWGDR
ncbi:MAG: hypothetical protein AAGA60_17065 [Cyanobacteria bacterium P01_E01_bin.42]